ncbi:hypothetical protein RJ639_047729 [Escallonia herrerae]|uniref:Zinc finger, CCHC-type n=1 Tax=Escallonia herrerae TaxID=1293975 RepID=A0AA88W6K5_9ASTE|nr:hypothetical protein RJ639_047729 [Escallonia herrerae]
MVNAKALWESLERKYKTEDAGSKKFVVGKFLDFKMVDSKTVISQVQEFQLILHDIHAEGMVLGESFQVAALIEKLPPTWKDFKNYLKHKRKEMKLEDLIVRLRIEEDNRQSEKKAGNYHQEAKANVVEQVTHIIFSKNEFNSCLCPSSDVRDGGRVAEVVLTRPDLGRCKVRASSDSYNSFEDVSTECADEQSWISTTCPGLSELRLRLLSLSGYALEWSSLIRLRIEFSG